MPDIRLKLSPDWDGEKIAHVGVEITADISANQGEALFFTNDKTIFKPFTQILEPVRVEDENGPLECEEHSEQRGYILLRSYLPKRTPVGTVTIRYALTLGPCGRNPVFDLGYEPGGMTGSGMTFLPAFPKGKYSYHVSWDLSKLPQGSNGVWSFGMGDTSYEGEEGLLMQTFYAAGELDLVKQGKFIYTWFKNPLLLEQATPIAQIFAYEQEFFHDKDEPYTIIARHTSDETSERAGGTALERSYSFLYLNDSQLDATWLKFLFAHEMVHNWMFAEDEPFGTCTWYKEGIAEYYSILLPWRMGVVSREEMLKEINKRAKKYYENPKIHVPNEILGTQLMADKDMTEMPYGRGFFYLLHADAAIRKATNNAHSLDDIKDAMLYRSKEASVGNEDWLEFYGSYVGEDTAKDEFARMSSGEAVWAMELDCINEKGGNFQIIKETGKTRGTEEDCELWRVI